MNRFKTYNAKLIKLNPLIDSSEKNISARVRGEERICKDDGSFVSTGCCYTLLIKCRH